MNNIVLHIPHASLRLPKDFYKNIIVDKGEINEFNKNITDLYTGELFGENKYKQLMSKYSRVFCDVEKFADDTKEEMAQFGMGFVYTHTNKGIQFLNLASDYKNKIYNNYYIKHHNKLDSLVAKSLSKGTTIMLDCHSFSRNIIMFEERRVNLPDICIGFDKQYYSQTLVEFIKQYFEKLGYSVALNYPYSGTMIPNGVFNKNVADLYCVMIEINKSLYLDDNNNKNSHFATLQTQIQTLLKNIASLDL